LYFRTIFSHLFTAAFLQQRVILEVLLYAVIPILCTILLALFYYTCQGHKTSYTILFLLMLTDLTALYQLYVL